MTAQLCAGNTSAEVISVAYIAISVPRPAPPAVNVTNTLFATPIKTIGASSPANAARSILVAMPPAAKTTLPRITGYGFGGAAVALL